MGLRRADICDECVKEIAVGHLDRVLGHRKYDRYVKFLIRKKAAARLKTCAFGGCESVVSVQRHSYSTRTSTQVRQKFAEVKK